MKLHEAVRLAKHASKHATAENAKLFANHVVPEMVRPARVIWNQAIGALFFVLAIPAAMKALQLYHDLPNEPKNFVALALCSISAVVMISFGISSFAKARRIAARLPRS